MNSYFDPRYAHPKPDSTRAYTVYIELEENSHIKPRRRIKHGKSDALQCDNGPEYFSQKFIDWITKHKTTLLYSQVSQLKNTYVKRFNRTARHEWLDRHPFKALNMHNGLPRSGYGLTIINDCVLLSVKYRQDNHLQLHSLYF